ncbi:MAG: transporter substrate-binding domain-containing protein [Anaerolineae bacterium]
MSTRLLALAAHLTSFGRWVRRHPRLALAGLIALLGAILAWGITRPGAPLGPQDGTWRRVQINRDLYVGMDPSYPPFAAWTPEQIVGIEADLAREIGRRLGVETHILIMGFDSLYDALYTGTVDMVIAGLHPNKALTEWVYYSQPYFDAGQVLVSPVSAPVDDMRDLDGKTLAVEMASAGDQAAQRWTRRLHSLTVQRFLLPQEAMRAVEEGQAAAALVDTISAYQYLAQHPALRMADHTTVAAPYAIAMRKANFRLTAAVERALKAIKTDGTLDAILARWLTGS